MFKLIIKRDGQYNIPLMVFDKDTPPSEIVDAVDVMIRSPGVYRVEMVGEMMWDTAVSKGFRFLKVSLEGFDINDRVQANILTGELFITFLSLMLVSGG